MVGRKKDQAQSTEEEFSGEVADEALPEARVGSEEERVYEGAAGVAGEPIPTKPNMVTYHGQFGAREITKRDWEKAGVADQTDVRWDRKNNFMLPKEGFSEAALRVLHLDPDFRIS